mgnify:FL=1
MKVNIQKYKIQLIIFLLLFLIFLCSLVLYLHFTNTEDLIPKKNMSFNFRQTVHTSDLIEKLNGRLLTNTLVDTNTVGKRKVQVSYYNHYGFMENKYVEIEIKDITPPTVVVNSTYYAEKGDKYNLLDKIFCADDYDDNVSCQITGDYNFDKVGKYPLKIVATDHSNNVTSKSFSLVISDKTDTIKDKQPSLVTTTTDFKNIYKKYKTNNTLIGLDLSKWQEQVDFDKIKAQGVEFVMLKIGGQSEKSGKLELDPYFTNNIEEALKRELKVGVYFYSHATSTDEARKQAGWVVKNLKEYPLSLPIAFDWENWNQYTSYHLSFHTLNNIANTFFTTLETKNYQTMLYSSKYYLDTVWYKEEYNIWLAHYTTDSKDKAEYNMWQLCNDGKIEGIDNLVDIDILYLKSK